MTYTARSPERTRADVALIEDLQSVLLDMLIEKDLHQTYQRALLQSLPPEIRSRVACLLQEDKESAEYLNSRIRHGLAILAEARPGPNAYNPDRCAAREIPRPLSLEVA